MRRMTPSHVQFAHSIRITSFLYIDASAQLTLPTVDFNVT
jgi:hypothetical protein